VESLDRVSLQTAEAKVSNLSIFLVEDEALIRMMTAEMIEELGYHVAVKAGTIKEAKSLAKEADFEFAILDINVGGQSILPVAQIVESRGVPFLFASGYGTTGLPPPFAERTVLSKPFVLESLREAITATLDGHILAARR
jgi:DNA-binding response OmpR family regulator